jgi:AcrR family transcriptional regulator
MKVSKKQKNIINSTKERIIEAAQSLFSEHIYLSVSMDDIAKKLNITKAALYYHFASKEEIYKKVLERAFDELRSYITKASREKTSDRKLYRLIKSYLDFGLKEKILIKAMVIKLSPCSSEISKNIIKFRKQVTSLFQSLIEEVLPEKKYNREFNSKLAASLLTGMIDGLLLECSLMNKKIDSGKMTNQIIAVLF